MRSFFLNCRTIFLNFKQAIARFPQLVRHQAAGQQIITAVPITQNCTPAAIRAPGEEGGAQPTRWGITTRCDDLRVSSRTRITNRCNVAPRVVVWKNDCQTRREPIHYAQRTRWCLASKLRGRSNHDGVQCWAAGCCGRMVERTREIIRRRTRASSELYWIRVKRRGRIARYVSHRREEKKPIISDRIGPSVLYIGLVDVTSLGQTRLHLDKREQRFGGPNLTDRCYGL